MLFLIFYKSVLPEFSKSQMKTISESAKQHTVNCEAQSKKLKQQQKMFTKTTTNV